MAWKKSTTKSGGPKVDVYQIVTDRIVKMLEAGTVPWQKPWAGGPRNLVSKKLYRGVNVWILAGQRYSSPFWVSFNQAKALGGTVRKGEKGTPVVYWNWIKRAATPEEKAKTGKSEVRMGFIRYSTVFNVAQCDGIPAEKIPTTKAPETTEAQRVEAAEKIAAGYTAVPVNHGHDGAFYRPSTDSIGMPERKSFHSGEEYYSTLFHEMGHSTGHASRLNRKGITNPISFGSHAYSQEELVAEMTATFLCSEAGIVERTIENSAAYIQNWLTALKNDRKLLVGAASQAQKAAELILGRTATVVDDEEKTPAPEEVGDDAEA